MRRNRQELGSHDIPSTALFLAYLAGMTLHDITTARQFSCSVFFFSSIRSLGPMGSSFLI